jgi:biopolymer transport protein ExbD
MGMSIGGSRRGTFTEVNVVPLIDILLVLLVIFMVIPNSRGMKVQVPQQSPDPQPRPNPDVVVVQVPADGTLKLNQQTVSRMGLRERLQEIFKFRADRVAFVRGENPVEFQVVAQVIDDMHAAGISSVGLLTPELEQNH